jgi:hypothetical protein
MKKYILLITTLFLYDTAFSQALHTNISLARSANTWIYTIENLEAVETNLFISAFDFDIDADIENIVTPEGWDIDTDNSTFISWNSFSKGYDNPYHIPPGGSLSFKFDCLSSGSYQSSYLIGSWNHATDLPSDISIGAILAPKNVAASASEPSTLSFLALLSSAGFGTKCLLGPRKNVLDQCRQKK